MVYFAEILLIATGLSMDTFAVALASGLCRKKVSFTIIFRAVVLLSLFQAIFATIGWFLGTSIHHLIAHVDHWVAFALLASIGLKMIWDAISSDVKQQTFDISNWYIIVGLSVATSIDALVVGMGLGFLDTTVFESVTIIGLVSLVFATAGFAVSRKSGLLRFGKVAEIAGGITLIALGTNVLYQHLIQ